MVDEQARSAYTVTRAGHRFDVAAPSGRVVMTCRDQGSADHYAALLSEAFALGYKHGYRDRCP